MEMFSKSFIIEDRFIYQTSSVSRTLKNEHYLRGIIKHCNYWICVYETIQYTRIENSVKYLFSECPCRSRLYEMSLHY